MPRSLLLILTLLLLAAPSQAAPHRLVLVGDSTVKNGQGRGDGGHWGWGQVLQPHFGHERLLVENRALGGRSSRTYLTEGLWEKSLERLGPGDFVLIQFGHNDGGQLFDGDRPRASLKGVGDESQDGVVAATGKAETVHTYGWYLRRYVEEAKAKGATPIVLSPVPRNIWKGGRVARASGDYGKWAREAAEAAGAAFLDLNEIVAIRYESEGQPKVAADYFTKADHTHTTRAGALVNAECVVEGLSELEASGPAEFRRPRAPALPSAFRFRGDAGEGEAAVRPEDLYDAARGYGYEPGDAAAFSVAVEPGNYLVEATLGDPQHAAQTAIEAEVRRTMTVPVATAAGEEAVRRFLVNVRSPAIESGGAVSLKERERTTEAAAWDSKLTLRLGGERPALKRLAIRPAPGAPTLYVLGDSTVADQPGAPWGSWGQKLPRWFGDRVAVANHAESGESVRGAWGARRFDKVLESLRAGDWLLVQFGHNDMKDAAPDALDRYLDGLARAVTEARRCGATPILVTPMERQTGVLADTLGPYPQAVRDLAAKTGTPLVDLHAASKRVYRDLGDRLPEAFMDPTHHSDLGAELLAAEVVKGLSEAAPELAQHAQP